MRQVDLFESSDFHGLPGLRYQPDFLDPDEERSCVEAIAGLPFRAFEFHGFTGKRRVVSFGWRYDFSSERLEQTEPIPAFLLPIRQQAARFAQLPPEVLEQVLVTEYAPGAAIGWHKDKAVFDQVVGVSLGSTCMMRFRRPTGPKWERRSVILEPGSAYLISGEARTLWEHSIPPVEDLRYSVTLRSVRPRPAV